MTNDSSTNENNCLLYNPKATPYTFNCIKLLCLKSIASKLWYYEKAKELFKEGVKCVECYENMWKNNPESSLYKLVFESLKEELMKYEERIRANKC